MRKIILMSLFTVLFTACGARPGGMGMGPGGMSERHHAQIPAEYAGMASPEITDDILANGAKLYEENCASCHGDTGMGDGPAAPSLSPAPAPVAHTSQMLGDAYLYWRTNEGGADFGSPMPAWKDVLTENEIWSVIAYIHILGRGEAAQIQALQHEQMLSQAVTQGLISQTEADTFTLVHNSMDAYRDEHRADMPAGAIDENQAFLLGQLVEAGTITQSQADDFARIHQLLLNEGLMQ